VGEAGVTREVVGPLAHEGNQTSEMLDDSITVSVPIYRMIMSSFGATSRHAHA